MTTINPQLLALDGVEMKSAFEERSCCEMKHEKKNKTFKDKKHKKRKEVKIKKEKAEISRGVYVTLLPDFEGNEKYSSQENASKLTKSLQNQSKKLEKIKKKPIEKQTHLIIVDEDEIKEELINPDTSENPTDLLVPEKEKVYECLICLENLDSDSISRLEICEHVFHPECLQQYFYSRIDEMKISIVCPIDGCATTISDSEVIARLDKKYKSKYQSFQLKQFMLMNSNKIDCCPTPDCEYFSYKVKGNVSFYCWTCSKTYCLECRAEWHDGMTCKENEVNLRFDENDNKFNEFVTSNTCRQCPSCRFYVHKVEGCSHITCICKYEFCYKCGSKHLTCNCASQDLFGDF